jgi:hypothetical protein
MRIFYLCPDMRVPSGGVLRLFTHVRILRDSGYKAYIVHPGSIEKPGWFKHDLPQMSLSDVVFRAEDVIVIPEGRTVVLNKLKNIAARKVVICLNPAYSFRYLADWAPHGIEWVMTNCLQAKEMIDWAAPSTHVHYLRTGVDPDIFYFEPARKKMQACYIKRHDQFIPTVQKVLRAKHGGGMELEFVAMENLSLPEYARVLRSSSVFITTASCQGFPRASMEAMACGCVCIGFDGVGGKDYLVPHGKDKNFYLVENMNFFELGRTIEQVCGALLSNEQTLASVRENGRKTAARQTGDLERESLLAFWAEYFSA